jgi:HK97 family phage major capsid protein
MNLDHTELETKAGFAADALVTHSDMLRAFEEFKSANDEREAKRADVLLDEKVARINAALDLQSRRLDELTLKSARPRLGAEAQAARNASAIEHKTAFEAYVRTGESAGLRALETKAMSVSSNPDGGYLVTPEVEQEIGMILNAF